MERPLIETGVGGGGNNSHWLTRGGGSLKGVVYKAEVLSWQTQMYYISFLLLCTLVGGGPSLRTL